MPVNRRVSGSMKTFGAAVVAMGDDYALGPGNGETKGQSVRA